jgi:hypothetical protein
MKFAKGKSKTGGRRKGTLNKKTMRARRARRLISEADDKAIIDQVVTAAKLGADPEARRLYFRYLRSPLSSETFVGPIDDYAAPKTLEEARAMFLVLGERLAKREISVEAHDALINGIKAYLGDASAEQERRLGQLEDLVRRGEST